MTATKAITERIASGRKLTKTQKIKVLKDARKSIEDPANWTLGTFVKVLDEDGCVLSEDDFSYIPSKNENVAMCVMGAVARAAGIQSANVDTAMNKLTECSIGTALLGALPEGRKILPEEILDAWMESAEGDRILVDAHGEAEVATWDADKLFRKFLKDNDFGSPLEWYVYHEESEVLNSIYDVNDQIDGSGHADVLALLDRAIANLEA